MPRTGSTSLQEEFAVLRPRPALADLLPPKPAPPGSPEGADVNHRFLG